MNVGVKLIKKSEPVVLERNTSENYDTAKMLAVKISPSSEVLFEMFVELSIGCGLTCGDCYGFQCSKCSRGIIVAYAIQNRQFFEWLHRNKTMSGVSDILNGISQINGI